MNIQENLLNINQYSRPGIKLNSHSYIVVHYTGSNGGRANAVRNYFNNLNGVYASSQYIIDTDGTILRIIPEDEVAWHSGDYNVNLNSIGIENCCFDRSGNGSATAGDWYFTDETQNSLVELVKDLINRYNIPLTNVIRHYDVTGKYCPAMWVKDVNSWDNFKTRLTGDITTNPSRPSNPQVNWYARYITDAAINVRSGAGLNFPILKIYKKGQIFDIYEENNGWGHTPSGWVKLSFCTKTSDTSQTATTSFNVKVSKSLAMVRTQPNSKAALGGSKELHQGDTFLATGTVSGQSVSGNNIWYKSAKR